MSKIRRRSLCCASESCPTGVLASNFKSETFVLHMNTRANARSRARTHTHTHTHARARTHARTHMHTRTHAHTCKHTRTDTQTYTYAHAHIHAHAVTQVTGMNSAEFKSSLACPAQCDSHRQDKIHFTQSFTTPFNHWTDSESTIKVYLSAGSNLLFQFCLATSFPNNDWREAGLEIN